MSLLTYHLHILSIQSEIDDLEEAAQCSSTTMLLNKLNVIASFDCQHIRNDGTLIPG